MALITLRCFNFVVLRNSNNSLFIRFNNWHTQKFTNDFSFIYHALHFLSTAF